MAVGTPIGLHHSDVHVFYAAFDYFDELVGLQPILEEGGFEIIGSVGSVDECLAFACHDDVSVYIVGPNIGETRGTTIVDLLRERNRCTRIIV